MDIETIATRCLALRRWGAFTAALLCAALLVGCGGGSSVEQVVRDQGFYTTTAILVDPQQVNLSTPGQATVRVVVVSSTVRDEGDYHYVFEGLTIVPTTTPGLTIHASSAPELDDLFRESPCSAADLPATVAPEGSTWNCAVYTLSVQADVTAVGGQTVLLSAQWTSGDGGYGPRVIERVGSFNVVLPGAPPLPDVPDFALGVVPLAKVYAPRGFVQVKVDRRGGFAAPVQLSLDGFASGITGVFTPNPVPPGVDSAQLRLEVPASHGGGTFTQLKVIGQGGGLDRSWQFGQLVDPLYTVTVATADGGPAVLTALHPLDLTVTLAFDPYGPFSLIGPGRLQLSLPDPPPDVAVEFLPDAQPGSLAPPVFPAGLVYTRTLRLSGPRIATMDDLRVRATALQLSADLAMQQPFVEGKVALRLDPSQSWDYVNSGATYVLGANDAIGIGMQSNNQPAIAWLEGSAGGSKQVFLKRFDGTVFAPSPSASGMPLLSGRIEQARMAMARNDIAHVASTYEVGGKEGAGVALGSAGASWSVHDEVSSLPPAQHARSPRIAAGFNDSLALSYLVETGIPAGAGSLFVRSRLATGALAALPGPRLDLSINVADSGQVLRDTPSLALGADGNPWLAWLEAPFDPVTTQPPALWLRGHDGTRWLAPIAVPRQRPLVAAPTQLLVTGLGRLIVAWFEGTPARLMLAVVDPATGVPTELRDPANPDGALNATSTEPAREASLTVDPGGHLVVAWTEGATAPALYAKRLNFDGTWARLGNAIDASRPTRSPFVTSDATGQLYVEWTSFFSSTNLDSPAPKTDVLVGRWVFP